MIKASGLRRVLISRFAGDTCCLAAVWSYKVTSVVFDKLMFFELPAVSDDDFKKHTVKENKFNSHTPQFPSHSIC